MNIHHCVLARVTASLMSLHSMKVCVSVAWIPGNSGIHYNEQADMAVKEALRLDTKLINGFIALPSCKRLLSKHYQKAVALQTRWERSTTARATFAHIPVVGRIIRFPQTRCSAVSYVRLKFSRKTANINVKKLLFYNNV